MEKFDYNLLVDTAILAGEIMLRNGAETSLVEGTIVEILSVQKVKHIEAVAMTTSIIATISDPEIKPITVVRRIKIRDTNISKICMVNDLTKSFLNEEISLEKFFSELKEISKHVEYPWWIKDIALVLIGPLFVVMLNGNMIDTLISSFGGIAMVIINMVCKKFKFNVFTFNFISTFFITLITFTFSKFIDIDADLVIISSIMPLVPGLAITNASMDTLSADYMSGIAKILEIAVRAASIAIGVISGICIIHFLLGGIVW